MDTRKHPKKTPPVELGKCPKCGSENVDVIPVGFRRVNIPLAVCEVCIQDGTSLSAWGSQFAENPRRRERVCSNCHKPCMYPEVKIICGIAYCLTCFDQLYYRSCTLCDSTFRVFNNYVGVAVCPVCVQSNGRLLIEALKDRVYKANLRQDQVNRLKLSDVLNQYLSQNGRCYYCAADLQVTDFHLEHKHPLSRGGTNTSDNVVFACPSCNLSKGAKTPDEWDCRF